jgi:hypothetical protein
MRIDDVEWIHLLPDRNWWQTLVYKVMNRLSDSLKGGEFLE